MISQSFIFLDRVSQNTEKKIWDQDIHTWDDFTSANSVFGFSKCRKAYYNLKLEKAKKNLKAENMDFFAHHFPRNQHWRLFNQFKDEACYLDIETSGYYGSITVIGIYDGHDTKTMVRGVNLNKDLLVNELKKYKLILTFNGSSFDLPVINRYFNMNIDLPHIDLRHVCSKIGLTGGLKKIEKTLNIKRADEVTDVDGMEAVYLWQKFKGTGDRKYLELLVKYNEEDIINLKPLAEHSIKELWKTIKPITKQCL